jgi:hypothetical protein
MKVEGLGMTEKGEGLGMTFKVEGLGMTSSFSVQEARFVPSKSWR